MIKDVSLFSVSIVEKKCDVMVAGIKHEGSRKLKGDNVVRGTISRRVHNLSRSVESAREQQRSEAGAEEEAAPPSFTVQSGAGISHSFATFYSACLGPVHRTELALPARLHEAAR